MVRSGILKEPSPAVNGSSILNKERPSPIQIEPDKLDWTGFTHHPANITINEKGEFVVNSNSRKKNSNPDFPANAIIPKKHPFSHLGVMGDLIVNIGDSLIETTTMRRGPPGGGGAGGWSVDITKDIDGECGYTRWISPWQYRYLYEREGIAKRIIDLPVNGCWAYMPEAVENEDTKITTPFEQDVAYCQSRHNLYGFMRLLDKKSRIGYCGILLHGFNDVANNQDLSLPVRGVDFNSGEVIDSAQPPNVELLYLQVFDETQFQVIMWEADKSSPRYMKPVMYLIRNTEIPRGMASTNSGTVTLKVHWTRVTHCAEDSTSNGVLGVPALQDVYNRVYDIRKILSGSGEMYWTGANPGFAFEINPEIAASGGQMPDDEEIEQELEEYSSGLRRFLAIKGLVIKQLAPQVKSPKEFYDTQIKAICVAKDYPLRIFAGTEQQQRTDSTEETKGWNQTLAARQMWHCDPVIARPIIDMYIRYGVVRAPATVKADLKTGKVLQYIYKIQFKDLNTVSDKDRADLAFKFSQAIAQYINGFVYHMIRPRDFFINYLNFTPEQADEMIENAGGEDEIIKNLEKSYDKLSNSLDGGVQVKTSPSAGDGKKRKATAGRSQKK